MPSGIASALAASTAPEKETIIDTDGTLVTYVQPYQATPEQLEAAEKWEKFITDEQDDIEAGFLRIGGAIAKFDEEKLYIARGCPSLRVWMEQPEFHFSYEHGTRMMRIVRDLLPVLGGTTRDLPLSSLKELLPMLKDGVSDTAIQKAADDIKKMTLRDARQTVRDIRGLGSQTPPMTIRAIVTSGTDYNQVALTMFHHESGDVYALSTQPLYVKKRDWAKFVESTNGTWMWEDAV